MGSDRSPPAIGDARGPSIDMTSALEASLECLGKSLCRRPFLASLAVLGLITFFIWLIPPIVLAGFLIFFLPGLILLAVPTIFLYMAVGGAITGAAVALLRAAGMEPGRVVRIATASAAATATVALGFLPPTILNPAVDRMRAELTSGDVAASDPITVPGTVGITVRSLENHCGSLCLRLLYNGAARRVVVSQTLGDDAPVAYEVERLGSCAPASYQTLRETQVAFPADSGSSVEYQTRKRMEAGECLVARGGSLDEAELVVGVRSILRRRSSTLTRALPEDTVEADRITISDGFGRVLFRRTEVRAAALSSPVWITSGSPYRSAPGYFGFARDQTTSGEIGPEGRDVLPALLGDDVRLPDLPNAGSVP